MRTLISLVRQVISINGILLFAACFAFWASINHLGQTSHNFSDLKHRAGIIEKKTFLTKYYDADDSLQITRIKLLDNDTMFSVSSRAIIAYNLLEVGDSVELFTKNISSDWGNTVMVNSGHFRNTHNQNEVFHILCARYPVPILDFYEIQDGVKNVAWMPFFVCIGLLVWYLYRRSNWRSPFIIESSG